MCHLLCLMFNDFDILTFSWESIFSNMPCQICKLIFDTNLCKVLNKQTLRYYLR